MRDANSGKSTTKQDVVAELPEADWPQYKNVEAVLRGTVPIDHRASLYVHWGDWLPWGCCVVIAIGFIWRRWPVTYGKRAALPGL